MVDNTELSWFCVQKTKTTESPPQKNANLFGKNNLYLIVTNKTYLFFVFVSIDYLFSDFSSSFFSSFLFNVGSIHQPSFYSHLSSHGWQFQLISWLAILVDLMVSIACMRITLKSNISTLLSFQSSICDTYSTPCVTCIQLLIYATLYIPPKLLLSLLPIIFTVVYILTNPS